MKVGFLPLYIKLYDDFAPHMRPRLEAFYETMAKELEARGAEVVRVPFCRIEPEFLDAVATFEEAGVDAIVTLHLAYSPSLESIGALTGTDLPIIIMDTTETLEFTNMQEGAEISYNHGIHGVMDLCSMLVRYGKPFAIATGHYKESDCVDRVIGLVRAARAARALGQMKVGLFGDAFDGMGDFTVPYKEMKSRFGIDVFKVNAAEVAAIYDGVTAEEIAAEKAENAALCEVCTEIDAEAYDAYLRSCLALRKAIGKLGLTAFSATFLHMGREESGLTTMPFMECCKAMARGIGYAGEGDSLTAAFVGALMQGYDETNFVEIFCPDWKNDTVFLSHMGETNYKIADCKPALHGLTMRYSGAYNPFAAYTRMKGGKGVYLNISRAEEDFKLVLTAAEMISYKEDHMKNKMRGWMRTGCSTADFLANLSVNGATHHSVFVYDATVEEIAFFGALLGLETVTI